MARRLSCPSTMRKSPKVAIAIAAVVAVAGVTSILVRHGGKASTPRNNRAQGGTPQIPDAQIVKANRDANVPIDGLSATHSGRVLVLESAAGPTATNPAAALWE